VRGSSGSWRRVALAAALAALVAGFAGPADAQGKGKGKAKRGDRIPVNVIVVYTSDAEGGVDPRARELDAKLKKQLRYKSMRVLQEERIYLDVDRVGTVKLPDGRAVRMRPMHKDEKGVLMAVDVPGAVNLDARTPNHHKVVIGAGEYEDGNLAISIEPDYEE
jgi:hypothetical protein